MASVGDPMKAWQDMIEQFQKAGLGSSTELLQTMLAPMQQQLDLFQKAFETQTEFNRALTEASVCPHAAGAGGPAASRQDDSRCW